MGARNISTKLVKARKDHRDDSRYFIEEVRHYEKLSFTEWRAIAELKANNWIIKKGQLYERQYNVQNGQVFTFRSLPAIIKICMKLRLYDDC